MERIETIARICHEANRGYCESMGDYSQVSWDNAPEWQKESAINGVIFNINNHVTPEETHNNWMKEKIEAGWIYGEVKDSEKKTHPCLVPYEQLPEEQKVKDKLFKSICDTLKDYL